MTDAKKNIPLNAETHARLVACAKSRGMTIQGLSGRIITNWLAENFFDKKVARGNKRIKRDNNADGARV